MAFSSIPSIICSRLAKAETQTVLQSFSSSQYHCYFKYLQWICLSVYYALTFPDGVCYLSVEQKERNCDILQKKM